MTDFEKPQPMDSSKVTMTIRLLMTGKEAGSIIGKGGEIIHKIREECGANIFISDGSVPERIITINGQTELVFKSIELICKRLEDEGGQSTLKMIVPASQCGSLIGKGGARIKEIREMSGATVFVASDMLPHSTERTVSVSGNCEAITKCIGKVVSILMETPPKGPNHRYTPKSGTFLAMAAANSRGGHENPLANLLGMGGGASTLAAIATLAGSHMRAERGGEGKGPNNTQTFEMSIPNDMIGCIIGKGGSKIAEIRKLSGAMITISKCDDIGSGRGEKTQEATEEPGAERHISITGNSDSVALAKSLLNMSLDLHKSTLEERNKQEGEGGSAQGNERRQPQAMGLAQILSKPEALTNALTTLASLSTLGGGPMGGFGGGGYGARPRGGYGGYGGYRNSERGRKFSPY